MKIFLTAKIYLIVCALPEKEDHINSFHSNWLFMSSGNLWKPLVFDFLGG